jgi:predicted small secreted protein
MIDFEAVIRHFGPQAVALQLEEADSLDDKALAALNSHNEPDRVTIVRRWLYDYQVFQGIDGPKRTAITEAVLLWADSQQGQSDPATLDVLVRSHAGLMAACSTAYGRGRDFTSLAYKALWLRYPDVVPMFDSFAQRALWVISKIEKDIAAPASEKSEYRKFAYAWRTLYGRYASTIAAVDARGYPYRVRIFDKILWIIGSPGYVY